jgi:hypothetical protein
MSLQDRYANPLKQKQLPNGKMVYRSLRPRSIKPDILNDSQINADDTIRMDKLAANVYSDQFDWWRIASANGRFQGSMFFKPGSIIIIPAE